MKRRAAERERGRAHPADAVAVERAESANCMAAHRQGLARKQGLHDLLLPLALGGKDGKRHAERLPRNDEKMKGCRPPRGARVRMKGTQQRVGARGRVMGFGAGFAILRSGCTRANRRCEATCVTIARNFLSPANGERRSA